MDLPQIAIFYIINIPTFDLIEPLSRIGAIVK